MSVLTRMIESLREAAQQIIERHVGRGVSIGAARSVSGGSINDAYLVETAEGDAFFVKANSRESVAMFECEAAGLRELARAECLAVPQVIGLGQTEQGEALLVLQAIRLGRRAAGFWQSFGERLAQLHRCRTGRQFGMDHSNYLGSTVQPNTPCDDWLAFWRQQRLGYQLRLARDAGRIDSGIGKLASRLLDRLDQWLGVADEPPCLIHGDLWSGNYLVGGDGQPMLIDPAVYYAHREAEFGMTTLFGGFPAEFYLAYQQTWPLPDGSAERIELYQLYHLLNHLNLFGGSYLGACVAMIRKYS